MRKGKNYGVKNKFRRKLGKKYSRRLFKKTASKTHVKNLRTSPMRGGIRM